MGSVPRLPGPGAAVTLRVRAVGVCPEVPVVQLWGSLGERGADYARLRSEVQGAAGPRLGSAPGPVGLSAAGGELRAGDVGLVELAGLWHRCRVVSRHGRGYRVFLLDEGSTVAVSPYYLARGSEELFRLPPAVLGCVVADLVLAGGPVAGACGDAPASACSLEAMEFLSSLHGKELSGRVREVVMPQLLVVLELPQLLAQLQNLGLARQVAPSWFCQLLQHCLMDSCFTNQLQPQALAYSLTTCAVPELLQIFHLKPPSSLPLDYFYPQLQLGVTVPVLVTHVSDPHHFCCQLQSLSMEIQRLSDTMCHFYDRWEQDTPPKVGSPCAARGVSGHWYRALLLEVTTGEQGQQVAQVFFVDYGRKETVTAASLRHLPAEYFRMPVVTYQCALQGVSDGGCGWSPSQITELKALVLGKRMRARIETFNSFEHLYNVTLYGENGVNLNHVFGVQACCLISSHLQVSQTEARRQVEVEESTAGEVELPPGAPPVALMHRDLAEGQTESLPAQMYEGKENLPLSHRQSYLEMRPGSSYGGQLEVGCTVNVVVTCAENPGCFWCQLKNCNDLTVLMAEIQEYCKNSSPPRSWPSPVCLAQYSEDGKWYRALIVSEVTSAEKVEVIYVDYGNRELVSLTSLRSMNERFLKLKAQAFRCSLYNLIQPNGQDPFVWEEAAVLAFQKFVSASSHQFELQCTVFALASINNRELFNIVDLMTPFQSACQFLTDRGVARCLSPLKSLASSIQLHSFYYSAHDIKIGSEEDIFITHVDDPWTFYCQLERCADVLAQLTENIFHQSETSASLETSQKLGDLCLARYTDNHWYRGVIRKTKPKKEVFFVDFGNTEMIEEDHLLPIPSDAYDILLLPMQAIRCSLSDIAHVPKEATTWFKHAVLERQLKAMVVAKESDGKLLIELFDGNVQINAKLKEGLRLRNNTELRRPVEKKNLCSRSRDVKERNEAAESPLNTGESKNCSSEAQVGVGSSKTHIKQKDVNVLQPATKRELAAELLGSDEKFSSNEDALLNKVGEEEQSLLPVKMDAQSNNNSDTQGSCIPLKKVSDLPQQSIVPALKVLTYVSYVSDPWDFYLQLASDEAQLNCISERLNNEMPVKNPCRQLFQPGDLISAPYSEDSLWYRAVVKEKTSDDLFRIQYIDYGNTSVIDVDQVRRLPEDLSSVPAVGIHCFLGGLKCKKGTDCTEKAVLDFTERVTEAQLMCEFVEKVEDKWRVILSDNQGVITVDLVDEKLSRSQRSCSTEILDRSDVIKVCEPLPTQAQNEASSASDCKSLPWVFPEAGQTVKIYITVVNGPEYFWSCSADTENMNYIEEKIKEAENLGLSSMNNCVRSGDICLAKYSQDRKFYRAKVTSIKGDDIAVRHVDYGSEETVSLEVLRQIPCELLEVPNQAFACCLSGFRASEGSWLCEAKDKFYDMTVDLLLEAEVIETQENTAFEVPLSVVQLETSGKSINEEMKSFWKADTGTGHKAVSNLESPLESSRCSSGDKGPCLERETAACGLAREESESTLLCSDCFLGGTSGCSTAVEANVLVGAVESGKVADGCDTAEHQSDFDQEVPLLEEESAGKVLLEPTRSSSLCILGSEMKSAVQEPPELLSLQDAELKAEQIDSPSLLLGDKPEELVRWPLLQPPLGDETEALIKLDKLEMHSYDDLKEFILELEELSVQPSFVEETKEALETEALEMPTASGSEAREQVLEREAFELPFLDEEIEQLAVLRSESLPSLNERDNLMPSFSDGGKMVELFPSDTQLSLAETAKTPELNVSGVHKADAVQEDWMEVDPPLVPPSSDGGPEKQLDLKTNDMLSMLGVEIEQLLELVLPDVKPSQEDGGDDLLGLEQAALQSSANSGSQFSFLTKDLSQRPVCTVKSCDCTVEKHEWQKKKDDSYVEEWMKQDLAESLKECASTPTHLQSSECKPVDEEPGGKQHDNVADFSAEHSKYTCKLKGFAVGSKCVVWTSLKWCEALILEVSEKGTRVLNLSSGCEETVDPENVWNIIPNWACRSSETTSHVTENVLSLPESLLQEEQTGCSSAKTEDPHVLQFF